MEIEDIMEEVGLHEAAASMCEHKKRGGKTGRVDLVSSRNPITPVKHSSLYSAQALQTKPLW